MKEVLISVAVLIVAGIVGTFIKPNADQLKPLEPQPGASSGHDHHH